MPRKQHLVHLTADDRQVLRGWLQRGTIPAAAQTRARILLKAAGGWTDARLAEALDGSPRTVARTRAAWVDRGRAAVQRQPRCRNTPTKLAPAQVDQLLAVATTAPPAGRARWTLRLRAQRAVELEIVDTRSYETVRRTLKKGGATPGRSSAS
ncbi:MAG TPA: helix-turn-helix domain-containing protein [Anaerolineae bacterium]|nr:helix-turn-helix domain-containing protein [Anaerolineae bacterium]